MLHYIMTTIMIMSYIMTIWRWEEFSRCDKFPTTPGVKPTTSWSEIWHPTVMSLSHWADNYETNHTKVVTCTHFQGRRHSSPHRCCRRSRCRYHRSTEVGCKFRCRPDMECIPVYTPRRHLNNTTAGRPAIISCVQASTGGEFST